MSTTPPPANGEALRVLVADEDHAGLQELRACLEALGHAVTGQAVTAAAAARSIAAEDPDLAIVMLHHDDEHALDLIAQAVEVASGPVMALSEGADAAFVSRAADRGIDAYADRLTGESIQAAIELALRRHRERGDLLERVDRLETALERQALIERAKGILMERHSVDERSAFELLRSHARGHSRRVVDVAASVVEGHALLPSRGQPAD